LKEKAAGIGGFFFENNHRRFIFAPDAKEANHKTSTGYFAGNCQKISVRRLQGTIFREVLNLQGNLPEMRCNRSRGNFKSGRVRHFLIVNRNP
jgi:hypothetical protein